MYSSSYEKDGAGGRDAPREKFAWLGCVSVWFLWFSFLFFRMCIVIDGSHFACWLIQNRLERVRCDFECEIFFWKASPLFRPLPSQSLLLRWNCAFSLRVDGYLHSFQLHLLSSMRFQRESEMDSFASSFLGCWWHDACPLMVS